MKLLILALACLLQYSSQRSTPEDDHYIAAVLEYQVNSDVEQNIDNYVRHVQEAVEQNADVVVFPEMTLTRGARAAPVPINGLLKDYPVPALNPDLYDEILVRISTAARQNEVYVVINIQEQMDCTNAVAAEELCPEERIYLFNTNVVFDRTGAVIDRYRKINLFGEATRFPALEPDLGLFTTDFGVTFGHFICFDLMFQVPAVQVAEKHNLTDIIFTTMWFSEMPFLTAVQIQEAYAYAMNVNFIASGANNVRVGSAGSGIYSGKFGALASTMPGLPATRLLVSRVPKVPGQVDFDYPGPIYDTPTDHDSLVLITDPSLPSHISRQLVDGFQEFTLVDKEVSCTFRARLNHRNGQTSYKYRAFVQDAPNIYVKRHLGIASCLVVACKDDDVKTCGYRYGKDEKTIEIEELEIVMSTYKLQYNDTLQCDNIVYYPSSLQITKYPLSPKNFSFIASSLLRGRSEDNEVDTEYCSINSGKETVTYRLKMPQDELISFGLWGRVFNKDSAYSPLASVTEKDVHNYLEIEKLIYGTLD